MPNNHIRVILSPLSDVPLNNVPYGIIPVCQSSRLERDAKTL